MKNILLLSSMFVIIILIGSCKKEPGPPPADDTIWLKGQLLSYYDDSPLSNATIKLYYSSLPPSIPDETVTTDSNGYFDYKQKKDTVVTAVPSLSGWWCPFEYGYQLNYPADGFENDSIIYLFHQQLVKVNLHFQSTPPFPETGNYRIQNLVNFPKLNDSSYFIIDTHTKMYTDTGTFVYFLSAVDGLNNSLWFTTELANLFGGNPYYTLSDSINFLADTTAGELVFDFYH